MGPRGLVEFARGVARLVYPNACLLCAAPEGGASVFRHGLCSECHRAVTDDAAEVCPRCAATIGPHTSVPDGCAACRCAGFRFDRTLRLGAYGGRLRDAILRMKRSAGEGLAEVMGRVAAERFGAQLAGRFAHRRAGRHHVIHHQDSRGGETCVPAHRERPSHVLAAGRRRRLCGLFCPLHPTQSVGERQIQPVRQLPRDRRSLVVTPRPPPPPVERNRHHHVDARQL